MIYCQSDMKEKIVEFVRSKNFRLIKSVGQGGTGKTVLLRDDTIEEDFICKKYSPYYPEQKELYFSNFVHEIKILHLLYHRNIVRIFNYYLYPESFTGYIIMEFVDGVNIETYVNDHSDRIDEVFIQTIRGFKYLETHGILHRDLRPDNILVDTDGVVKIIDFGFGKRLEFGEDFDKSISINWRYDPPSEFKEKIYDYRTEIYFVGKLFEELLRKYEIQNFSYTGTLKKMIQTNHKSRINSFLEIEQEILQNEAFGIAFTDEDKKTYQEFANGLFSVISKLNEDVEYKANLEDILQSLEEVHSNSMLEYNLPNSNVLVRCFLNGGFRYVKRNDFSVRTLKSFVDLLRGSSKDKQRVILNHFWQRFDAVDRIAKLDDLPF